MSPGIPYTVCIVSPAAVDIIVELAPWLLSTPSGSASTSTVGTVAVNVGTLSTALAAAIQQAAGSNSNLNSFDGGVVHTVSVAICHQSERQSTHKYPPILLSCFHFLWRAKVYYNERLSIGVEE